MRIRAAITVALAALAVAVLMAMPAFAAKGGTEHPWQSAGTQSGTFTFKAGPPEVFKFDIVGPFTGSPLGKGTERTYSTASGKDRTIYTVANGDKLYATGLGEASSPNKGIVCPVPTHGATLAPWYGWQATSETMIIEGGTGRFKTATGKLVSRGCLYFLSEKTWMVTYSEKGTLTY